ncbi:hypothetical protein RV01_GL001169 [Enterococcus dispar]|nr:hypothetical protein RV01_GL001169 [Enterococcus dispar]
MDKSLAYKEVVSINYIILVKIKFSTPPKSTTALADCAL